MLKNKIAALALMVVAWFGVTEQTNAGMATNVACYVFPTSLPDSTRSFEFITARDRLMSNLIACVAGVGSNIVTGSFVGNPAAVRFHNVCDANDIAVGTNKFWRSVFNPPTPYDKQYGQREYFAAIFVGIDGQINIPSLYYEMSCGISSLNNTSTLSGLNYSVSRIGVMIATNGSVTTDMTSNGTNLVDAIVFIGGRIGASVNVPLNMTVLDNAVGASNYISCKYVVKTPGRTNTFVTTILLYQSGNIPATYDGLVPFRTSTGLLMSIVGPTNSRPVQLQTTRNLFDPFVTVNATATEGSSVFLPFTGNSTNDFGYARIWYEGVPTFRASTGTKVSKDQFAGTVTGTVSTSFSDDSDQDYTGQ